MASLHSFREIHLQLLVGKERKQGLDVSVPVQGGEPVDSVRAQLRFGGVDHFITFAS
jgi:hypothetical protein